ncbi:unnamed protein product, partial [Closterium sp. Naga37s-1]
MSGFKMSLVGREDGTGKRDGFTVGPVDEKSVIWGALEEFVVMTSLIVATGLAVCFKYLFTSPPWVLVRIRMG